MNARLNIFLHMFELFFFPFHHLYNRKTRPDKGTGVSGVGEGRGR
jgi:hypothetical protein